MSPSVGTMFKDVDLPHYFISKSNKELEQHLKDKTDKDIGLRHALEWRLNKILPYQANYAEAIALISRPENITKSVALLMEIADIIAHYALKDTSADVSY